MIPAPARPAPKAPFGPPRPQGRVALALALGLVLLGSCTTVLRSREEVAVPDYKIVLTFDDGPSETPLVDDQILDLLQEEGVQASFCLLTSKLRGNGRVLKRILQEGHTVVFHSRSHEEYLTKSWSQFEDELGEFERILAEETGIDTKVRYFRPPVGLLSLAMVDQLRAAGIQILYATHNPTDTFVGSPSGHRYIRDLVREFESTKGGILVLHNGSELFPRPSAADFALPDSAANRSWVPRELKLLLGELGRSGFRFIPIEEVPL